MRLRITTTAALLMAMSIGLMPVVSAQDTTAPTLVSQTQFDDVLAQVSAAVVADSGAEPLLDAATIEAIAGSPAGESLAYLVTEFVDNPAVQPALNAVVAGLRELPAGYDGNPWKAASSGRDLLQLLIDNFLDWAVFLPGIEGDQDNGLFYIERFVWFYYLNEAGQDFVQGRDPLSGGPLEVGPKFLKDFSNQRGEFMWSPESTTLIEQWVSDPRIEIEDYQKTEASDFDSFNAFFARDITIDEATQTIPSRPATMPVSDYPERDYIVVAPTDCIMNPLVQVLEQDTQVVRRVIDNPLQYNTVLDVKGIPISMDRLLGSLDDELKQQFVGGTGLSCVLMPNTYHYFHSPVNGTVVHAEIVESDGTYGVFDFPNWAPLDGNVGRPGTDFSQFEVFQRGVIVIEVKYADVNGSELTGYVASIPVGLNTIGSVVLDEDVVVGAEVKRGYSRLGNFFYGGSLNIMLFSKGLATGAIQTRLGNQIALYNIGNSPPVE